MLLKTAIQVVCSSRIVAYLPTQFIIIINAIHFFDIVCLFFVITRDLIFILSFGEFTLQLIFTWLAEHVNELLLAPSIAVATEAQVALIAASVAAAAAAAVAPVVAVGGLLQGDDPHE